jgi:predicted nucleic acid-binding protein
MILVLDASVIVKWLLQDSQREENTEEATEVVRAAIDGHIDVVQPVHWLVEVGGVLARISPQTVEDDVIMLHGLGFADVDDPAILRRGCRLAIELNHHLFDTLYHAVALETSGATLVTADNRYLNKARSLGRIVHLSEWKTAT